eukprot:3737279-Rhodomonas_salina.3
MPVAIDRQDIEPTGLDSAGQVEVGLSALDAEQLCRRVEGWCVRGCGRERARRGGREQPSGWLGVQRRRKFRLLSEQHRR